jgi:hypothetical protein
MSDERFAAARRRTMGVTLVPFTWRRHEARYRRIVTDSVRGVFDCAPSVRDARWCSAKG